MGAYTWRSAGVSVCLAGRKHSGSGARNSNLSIPIVDICSA